MRPQQFAHFRDHRRPRIRSLALKQRWQPWYSDKQFTRDGLNIGGPFTSRTVAQGFDTSKEVTGSSRLKFIATADTIRLSSRCAGGVDGADKNAAPRQCCMSGAHRNGSVFINRRRCLRVRHTCLTRWRFLLRPCVRNFPESPVSGSCWKQVGQIVRTSKSSIRSASS